MEICDTTKCTGCMACVNICPVKALTVGQDERGFYIPKMLDDKCINCGQCVKVCPNNTPVNNNSAPKGVYAAWAKDESIREKSTSGGLFSGIANWILKQDGYVFGVAFDENNVARHICIDSANDIYKLRGSKYVQSNVGDSYSKAKELLKKGKPVLFTGTPCQIAGLYNYLKNGNYPNLYTMDIVCHGVPSPKIFECYLTEKERRENSNAKQVYFRYKKPSWTRFSMKIVYENGNQYISECHHDPYLIAFLSDYISRECCHSCNYTNISRNADITVADFWSYVSYSRELRNNEKGISLVLVNSDKGQKIFNEIKTDYVVQERTIEEAKRGNKCLSKPFSPAKDKEIFWNEYLKDCDFKVCANKYFPKKKLSFKHRISEELNRYYYLLPGFAKKKLNNYLKSK